MTVPPFFSFIIPVYNVENYLKECLESVLNQSFKNYEIVLIDDGSTDSSLNICNYYSKIDDRVKVVSKKNEGLAETRNRGLEDAKGEYIIFLDSDDHLEKTGKVLLDVYNLLKDSKIDVLLFHLTPFVLNSDLTYDIYQTPRVKNIEATNSLPIIFKKRMYLATACNKIIKREVVFNNQLKFPKGLLSEDIKWCGDILKYTNNIFFYPIDFYFYRKKRIGSITYKVSKKNILDIAYQLKIHLEEEDIFNKENKYINEFYAFYFLSCLKQMIDHEDFSLDEIIGTMKPMSLYLKLSNEVRIKMFRNITYLFSFSGSIKILMLLSRRK